MAEDNTVPVSRESVAESGLISSAWLFTSVAHPESRREYFEGLGYFDENQISEGAITIGGIYSALEGTVYDITELEATDENIGSHVIQVMDINGNKFHYHFFIPDDIFNWEYDPLADD